MCDQGSIDRTCKIWNVATGKCENTLRGHNDEILDVAFNLTGSKLVTASADGSARIYNTMTGACLAILTVSPRHRPHNKPNADSTHEQHSTHEERRQTTFILLYSFLFLLSSSCSLLGFSVSQTVFLVYALCYDVCFVVLCAALCYVVYYIILSYVVLRIILS